MSQRAAPDSKQALRDRLVAARRALSEEARAAASLDVTARVAALPEWAAAGTVALYAPLGAEVDPGPLARLAAAAGKRLAWPRIVCSAPSRSAVAGGRRLELAPCSPEELVPGPARALEPPASHAALDVAEVGVVCVPGLAFDLAGHRLGRGGGYYDALLASAPGLKLALAFELQLVDAVPVDAHDVHVDAIATESRLIRIR